MVGSDIDPNDDADELALCMYQKVWAWNHNASNLNGFPADMGYNHRGAATYAMGSQGYITFASDESNGMAHVLQHTGISAVGWPVNAGGNVPRGMAIADMDNNLSYDIAGGTGSPGYLSWIWNLNSTPLNGWPIGLTQNVTGIAIGDVNNDGALELVLSSTTLCNKRIWVISASGEILSAWRPQSVNVTASENPPALADLDGNGDLEILWSGWGDIYAWNHDGTEFWDRIELSGGDLSPIAIGDLEGDGDLEFVVTSSTRVMLFSHDGTLAAGAWPYTRPGICWVWSSCETSGPIIGDIDEDNEQEIVLNMGGSRWGLIAFEADGSIVRGFPTIEPPNYSPSCTPVMMDIDRDGDVEICSYAEHYAGGDYHFRAVVYDLPSLYTSCLVDWPMRQRDPHRSGCYGGAGDFANSPSILTQQGAQFSSYADEFILYAPHPNPFNASTTISCQLPAASCLSLVVYDIMGREVANLYDGFMGAGYHEFVWDAKGVGSGVYFAVLKYAGSIESRKLLLLK